MNKNILMMVFLCLTFSTSSSCQAKKDLNSEELNAKASHFIENLSNIVNGGNVNRLKSELIVSKDDLRNFLDQEWKRKYNYFARRSMKDKFEPSVDKGWKEIQRNDGYYLIGSIVQEKDLVSKQKIFNPTFKNCRFSETTVEISDTYDSSKGEISMLRLINVKTLVVTDTYPIYTYQLSFPCAMTKNGDLKIVGFVNGNLISTDMNNE